MEWVKRGHLITAPYESNKHIKFRLTQSRVHTKAVRFVLVPHGATAEDYFRFTFFATDEAEGQAIATSLLSEFLKDRKLKSKFERTTKFGIFSLTPDQLIKSMSARSYLN